MQHKKQTKKQNKNKVGIHKNTPQENQITHEEFEEFINSYLEIKSYEDLFDILEEDSEFFDCDCNITEEMLLDCLIDGPSPAQPCIDKEQIEISTSVEDKKDKDSCGCFDISKKGCSFLHSDEYNSILELYRRQKEINRRNKVVLKEAIVEPLRYFGNVELLRDIDSVLENIFKKRKYKKPKKSNKIFERGQKPVDNSAAEEIVERRKEFKKVFTNLEFPISKDRLVEENVETNNLLKKKFIKY
ncbi:hypothetical protein NGRA_2826 [Nosema granulosis]|uniref:Uncharacterized protein n=1 Tax=Nosema granulosis TaxID=83296 RepID=A0A9P6GXC3_9MICR|nr:hypothetical protein NGRA_2826 [Nosema granulosis]